MPVRGAITRTQWLCITLPIAAIIALIAIPNIKLARMTANGAAAKRSIRAINIAQAKFLRLSPQKGYACSLARLGEAHLITDSLASGTNRGYIFEVSKCGSGTANSVYRLFAHPVTRDQTGHWVFCSNQTGLVRASPESREDCFDNGVEQH